MFKLRAQLLLPASVERPAKRLAYWDVRDDDASLLQCGAVTFLFTTVIPRVSDAERAAPRLPREGAAGVELDKSRASHSSSHPADCDRECAMPYYADLNPKGRVGAEWAADPDFGPPLGAGHGFDQ